jgi:hypothetical protein
MNNLFAFARLYDYNILGENCAFDKLVDILGFVGTQYNRIYTNLGGVLMNWSAVAILVSFLAFGVAAWLYTWVKSQPSTNAEVARIGDLIQK